MLKKRSHKPVMRGTASTSYAGCALVYSHYIRVHGGIRSYMWKVRVRVGVRMFEHIFEK